MREMTDLLKSGMPFIFMKVGTHAREELSDIVARKRKEIEDEGYALWGYGGNTCHPLTTVQPFARDYVTSGGVVYLCMQSMTSRHFAVPERAAEFSVDGFRWQNVPPGINVLGSRYAMAIDQLREEEFDLALENTQVVAGMSSGRRGDEYISGRVDKGLLKLVDDAWDIDQSAARSHIALVARVVDPFAVLVR